MLREENHRKRQKKQSTKYADPVITAAWAGSLDSKGFRALLEAKGYELAQGRKRMVVVDPQGKTHNPVRHLPGIRASAFEQRMSDLDPENLPTPEAIVRQRNSDDQKQKSHQAQYEERAADAINNLRSRQHEEWSEVSGRHDRIIRLKVRELSAHYSLEEHQNQIHSLQVKLSTPGRLRKLANKYLRWDRITTARVESLQATQNNARQRFDEVIDHLKQERLKALQTLEHSHNRDGEELAARLEKWKPEDRRLKQSRLGSDREHEHGREQNKDRPRLNR